MRTIILHYHLFKNAGTSVDRILQQNFGDGWLEAEFPHQDGDNSHLVTQWIAETPQALAYSSHTAVGPVPKIDGVCVLPILFLRDPVARIRSAYAFEREQISDSWGAQLAKTTDLAGYVHARIEKPQDRQVQNFQTWRLSLMRPGPGSEFDRARDALQDLAVIGLVDAFSSTMGRLANLLQADFPDFTWTGQHANASSYPKRSDADIDLDSLLQKENSDDLRLLNVARQMVARSASHPEPQTNAD